MSNYTLSIVTYDRGRDTVTGKIKPHHWAFFLHLPTPLKPGEGSRTGIAHQLRVMPGAFYYPGAEKGADPVTLGPGPVVQELEVGEVDEASLERVEQVLRETPIDKSESSGWNCQSWTLEGLERLRTAKLLHVDYSYLTKEGVRAWLREPE
ncbi:uncharacterized protein EI97DRAFT_227746 [Westerdykella ornata]|uniref:Uncharacterized protein n=1 Tax=Westerdykella ornata TaxID=318751 RepID=A0A6A6JSM6_WESOR|nr:uncharacterized protein EI97DRAFT_227746 [Westerdykella ornata]KAF2279113.1 hypothetical protein EI97DRAFT_227746 [Westerdykella ornata]